VPFAGDSPTMVMMKHLQEPVPSILDERTDVPPPVARVVARAMAKVPDNRYQNVAELVEDLTIAAGMSMARAIPPAVLTTTALAADDDERTMVRAREELPLMQRREPVMIPVSGQAPPPAPAPSGFNPMNIIIPAVVALLVVFAAIYAFNRNAVTTNNTNTNPPATLAADPNSQPVQPASPATGKGEEGIPAGGSIKPSANANANANANAAVSPEAIEDITPAANTNVNANENSNANTNSNRKAPALPEPTRSVVPETVPPPTPSATKPAEKPTATPTP